MKRTKLASRYATALFEFAEEMNKIEEVYSDVSTIDQTFDDNKELRNVINSPIIHADKKIAVIDSLFQHQINEITLKYLHLIIRKSRELQLDAICNEFVKLYKKNKNIVTLVITSAKELSQDSINAIVNKVKSFIDANIEIETRINPALIGGYRLHFNDYYVDATVKGCLDKLKKELVDKSYQVNF